MKNLDTNDPKSVAQFQRTLDQLKTKLTKLGVPETDVKNGVGQLEKILHTVQAFGSPSETVRENALQATEKQLGELKEMPFSSGSLAAGFRTVAFALSGVAALSQDKKTLSDPSVQNLIGSLGLNVGAVQDGTAFAAKLGLIDEDGSAGQWGAAASKAGDATAKFVGFLDAAYFTAGGIKAYQSGDIPSTVVNGIGAGGAALAAFGEAAGLGAWAGPVGVGVTVLAAAGLELTEHSHEVAEHTEVEEDFLKGAGLTEDAAKSLSSDAAQEATTVQQQLKLSPDQLQSLAAAHPELFNRGPGYTQAVISFANANGIQGQDVKGFLDAAQKDDPNYIQRFFNLNQALGQAGHPLTQQAAEFKMIAQTFPNAARYVQQHSPELVGPAADARRQAGVDYENAAGSINSQMGIANLLKAHPDPAYQAEIVKIMKDNGTLASFVRSVGNEYAYNGWPQAAQSGIRAAASAGVLTQPQAGQYLQQLS
jgi:hypothetical protein